MSLFSTQDIANVQFNSLTQAQVYTRILRDLGLASTVEYRAQDKADHAVSSPLDVINGEILRVALWSLSDGGLRPVYTTRLLHVARHMVDVASFHKKGTSDPEGNSGGRPQPTQGSRLAIDGDEGKQNLLKLYRDILEELALLGDIASLPHGYWLPAPLHLVSLSSFHRWILIGGRPSRWFPEEVRKEIAYNGLARFLMLDPADLGLREVVQSEREWYRIPHNRIDTWAQDIILQAKLQPIEGLKASFEFYAPEVRYNNAQYFRWTHDAHAMKEGRYLMRSISKAGIIHYAVAEISGGSIIATCSINLNEGDPRRLLYGLDTLAHRPTRVQAAQVGNAWFFTLQSELPRAEYRLFTALGSLHFPSDGRYYPRVWEI